MSPAPSDDSPRDDGARPAASPLVVVSNRLPFSVKRTSGGETVQPSSGGLIAAIDPVLRERGGTWIGWSGGAGEPPKAFDTLDNPYRVVPVGLSEKEIRRYYEGLANGAMWPLLHSLVGRARFDHREWDCYEEVNERFAHATAETARPDDLVWFHDYHLMRTPLHFRRLRPDARVLFFLHVPFPPHDIFRLFPWDRPVLRGLLSCDVIGFHVRSYARNFLDCAERLLGARVDRKRSIVRHGDRTVRVRSFPLGIDFERFETLARSAPRDPAGDPETDPEVKVVLGVDRLDYTKGIPERIQAFERLLVKHPSLRERVRLVQLAVPSRSRVGEYGQLKRQIDELVGRVNGRFGTARWTPIHYLYRSVPQEKLAAMFRDADVALITPLRDGMNLVAKEFVASQVDEPGVLVLSRMAGCAETMREALLINPYDTDGTADALHRALTMEETERRSRLVALRRRERQHDVHDWLRRILDAAAEPPPEATPPVDGDFEAWFGDFLEGHHVSLCLDYDGTLSPIVRHPSEAHLTDETREALSRCAERDDLDIAIVSGRSLEDVRTMVGIPGVTYAGNHGLEMEGPAIGHYRHEDLKHFEAKIGGLAEALDAVASEGAWVEEKGPTLTFHVRQVPASLQRDLLERAREVITDAGFQARDAHAAIEARPPIPWDKGHAVLHLLRVTHGRDWSENVRVIYAGDDVTDEDAFRRLAGLGLTFRIGPFDQQTSASYRLPDPDALRILLSWLADRPRATAAADG